jgi:HAD superfamily hydrolase (TIGR01484 family)
MVFDLDGTLAESKQRMPAEMGDLLAKLLQKMPVAIMSGAGFKQFEKQFFPSLPSEAPLDRLYIFPNNAAQCFVHKNGAWHPQYDQAFSPAEKEHIVTALKEALRVVGLASAPVRVWGERIEDREAEIAFSPLGQDAPLAAKEEWHEEHNDLRKKLHEELKARLPNFTNAMGGLTTIDITRKDITKAYGVERLAELTGIGIADMLYVGDALEEGGNDAVVISTGIPTHAVFGPGETAALIEGVASR